MKLYNICNIYKSILIYLYAQVQAIQFEMVAAVYRPRQHTQRQRPPMNVLYQPVYRRSDGLRGTSARRHTVLNFKMNGAPIVDYPFSDQAYQRERTPEIGTTTNYHRDVNVSNDSVSIYRTFLTVCNLPYA